MPTPPFKNGDRQVWHGRPHAPSNLLAYDGRSRFFLYGGLALSGLMALVFSGNWDEVEGGMIVFALVLVLGPAALGLAAYLLLAAGARKRRQTIQYGVTATRAIIGALHTASLRYELQPDDPIEVFRAGKRWAVRFNDGRVKRVWETQRGGAPRQSYLRRMRADAFTGLTEEEAREAERALLAARDAAASRAA